MKECFEFPYGLTLKISLGNDHVTVTCPKGWVYWGPYVDHSQLLYFRSAEGLKSRIRTLYRIERDK